MPRPEYEPAGYLSKRGRKIFLDIVRHVKDNEIIHDIDTLELSMLANCFDLYETAALYCRDKGITDTFEGKNGAYKNVVPEYNVMQQQYDKILKHSSKFGLNPGDRAKIFGGLKKKRKADITAGLDD